ncbi:MAG: hypothetical protein C5B49_10500, partial [Bdellovibrio sp.]
QSGVICAGKVVEGDRQTIHARFKFFEKTHLEKIGQFLSFWPEVPIETQRELSLLQEQNSKSDLEEVKSTIFSDMRDKSVARFIIANLDPEPLGVGTIGEVYKSKLPDGTPIAVKVVTPSKEANFRATLGKANRVKHLLGLYRDEVPFASEAIRFIEMFEQMTTAELDLTNELVNAQRFQQLFGNDFEIPHHYAEYSSAKVEVQQFIHGTRLKDMPVSARSSVLNELKAHFMLNQVATHGFYGSDFQPGNIQIDPRNKTQLIDFGQMGVLNEHERQLIASFVQAYQFGQASRVVQVLEQMGAKSPTYSAQTAKSLEGQVRAHLNQDHGHQISRSVSEIFRACGSSGLIIDLPYLQLVKGLATLEGTINTMASGQHR